MKVAVCYAGQEETGLVGMEYWLGRRVVRRMMFVIEEMKHWILLVRVLFWNELTAVVELLYICAYRCRRERVLMCLSSVMVLLMLPYSCLQLRICSA